MTHSATNRVSTFVLAAGVLALAATDWMVVNSIASGDDDAVVVEAPAPSKLPQKAFLTGKQVVNTTTIDGVTYTVERRGALGYALTLHNPTDAAISVKCDLQSWVTEGSRRGRMMPRPVMKASQPLEVALDAGATHSMALAFADPAPKADKKVRKGWFRTVSFQLREPEVKLTGLITAELDDAVAVARVSKKRRRDRRNTGAVYGKLLGQIRWTNPAAPEAVVSK